MTSLAAFFGPVDQLSAPAGLATAPVAARELAIGLWMLVRGFREPAR